MDQLTQLEPVEYHSLDEDEIRLISFDVNYSPVIKCYLHHEKLSSNPSFCALSYVWGSTENMQVIIVDEGSLQVTQNLYDALLEFRRRLLEDPEELIDEDPRNFYLWVDAICINQTDIEEKAFQIPKMGDIYTMSEQVVAWLGPINPEERDSVAEMSALLETFQRRAGGPDAPLRQVIEEYTEENLKEARNQSELSKFIATLKKVGNNAWFTRIWIAQEVVLAQKRPILLLGPVSMDLKAFLSAWIYLVFRSDYVKSSSPLTYFMLRGQYEPLPRGDVDQMSTADLEAYHAFKILRWLDRTYHLNATVPHDRIYGLLGLLRGWSLPQSMLPDYKQPYENVYFQYTRFILSKAKDTRVLGLGPIGALNGVPSWVPDLRNQVPIGVDNEPDNPSCSCFSFSIETNVLRMPGIILGRCISVFPAQPPRTATEPIYPLSKYLDCEKAILSVSSSLTDIPRNQLLQQWLRSRVSRFFQNDPWDWPDGFEQAFVNAYESMIQDKPFIRPEFMMRKWPTIEEEANDLLYSAKWQYMILGQGSFVLEDGTTGFLWDDHANPEQGDILCVFPALLSPILVRSDSNGQYRMVGTTTLDKYPRGLDDDQKGYQDYSEQFVKDTQNANQSMVYFDII
ncbi:heterokaryon incompatibility protein-domain-containing protein [Annulohypoxylon maeteangense]|uniref:heterokaryon incompatibility protein-domain-containing protein n=1 Tax=Annulohypoxylon maeteangense TaxID=1927788 RepID=UPI0020087C84|nr:heterokaryon incompatibility protein-domain-containing protein [Annulohypoxylon maeteangense]KAI0882628.1 heterokaryon incompatibility protein-domain-containing protein [Annulohypoxylon maeteangense]